MRFLGRLQLPAWTGSPASPSDGEVWYDTLLSKFRARENGATKDLITAAGSGSYSLTTVEVNLGSVPKTAGRFQVTGLSGLSTGRPVAVSMAVGPYTGKGTRADEAEMDGVAVAAAVLSATVIQCYWTATGPVRGNFKFDYVVG